MLLDRGRNVHTVSEVVRVFVQGVHLQASCLELEIPSAPARFTSTFSSSRRTLLDLVIAITHILSLVADLKTSVIGCKILGLVVHFCLVGANLWYGYLVLDLFRAIRNPFG